MTKQSFIKGTMILLAAGIVNRILGFVPRIALPRVIGAEGVGLYQLGYPFFIVILTIITGGIPLAIAKLVAEAETEGNERKVKAVLRTSLLITVAASVFFTILCIVAAPWITTHVIPDSRVYYTFLSMTPMIIIVGISSVYRGYFQGRHNMIPTAVSGLVETVIRIFAMLGFSYLMLPYGIEFAAAGAMLGVLAGELGGIAVLLGQYNLTIRKLATQAESPGTLREEAVTGQQREGAKKSYAFGLPYLGKLMRISIPVTGGKLVGSFSYLFESIMIARSLAIAGVATGVATAQYGALQGMVIPLLLLPSALTYSLAVSLVPSLSEAAARGDQLTIHKRLHQSLRLALVTGAPCAVLLYVLAEPLCLIMYGSTETAGMLKMMAPFGLFIYFQAPLQATLQALNKPGTALFNTFVGASIKLILIYQLATQPELGITGAVIAICVNVFLVTVLHGGSVMRLLNFRMKMTDFLKVGGGMAGMALTVACVTRQAWTDSLPLQFTAAAVSGVFVYLLFMIWFGLIDRADLQRLLWMGRKIVK
ncbi:membrane protein [Paenibacillus swuensis]|uniref:Membrane protein n=1 Tax=Paenibacillus swuensis TaxID=1178515 RepID=A0A172TJG5_9BACL|nr:stage V sporulation protein B [Paenibacillus swuensis]ANE47195.1 membrane protein [Paenibacillus swuensis]